MRCSARRTVCIPGILLRNAASVSYRALDVIGGAKQNKKTSGTYVNESGHCAGTPPRRPGTGTGARTATDALGVSVSVSVSVSYMGTGVVRMRVVRGAA